MSGNHVAVTWDQAKEISIFRAYVTGSPSKDLMREHNLQSSRVSQIIRRRLARLRQRGLHSQLEAAGCSLACIVKERAPEYVTLFELSQQHLSPEKVERLWFAPSCEF